MNFVLNDESLRLRWTQSRARRVEDRSDGVVGISMAGNCAVVLNSENQNPALSVGERGYILCHLVAYRASITRTLHIICSLEERLPVEVLTFVLMKERSDIKT
jgi:hypothetical protein